MLSVKSETYFPSIFNIKKIILTWISLSKLRTWQNHYFNVFVFDEKSPPVLAASPTLCIGKYCIMVKTDWQVLFHDF